MAIGDKMGIGQTFDEAVAKALGVSATSPPPGGGRILARAAGGSQSVEQRITADLERSKAAFDRAQAALTNGDLGLYQQENAEGVQLARPRDRTPRAARDRDEQPDLDATVVNVDLIIGCDDVDIHERRRLA